MAHIIPFKGLRYNKEKISNLASVVTPPYDVIDEVAQARYYAEHPANIIRLELGLSFSQDTPANNRYTRAKQYLEKWLEEEILLPEDQPAIYVYQQEFFHRTERVVRTGIVAGLKVEPYETGSVLPHEETLSKPKADRLQLMRSTSSNFSSIFGLYADEDKFIDHLLAEEIKGRLPDIDIIDEAGETHRIWVISQPDILDQVVRTMEDKQIYIADGHHRYETALEYAREMADQGSPGYDYVMATLVNLYDPGLVVLPTHRVVGNIQGFKPSRLIDQLGNLFEVTTYQTGDINSFMTELESRSEEYIFGLYTEGQLYQLQLKDFNTASQLLPADRSGAWKELDVAILDNLILDQMLSIGEQERRNQDNLAYSRSAQWVIDQVNSGNYQLGLLINATRVEQIVKVAQARDKMPQKSTYFYPKLITGLILNNLSIK